MQRYRRSPDALSADVGEDSVALHAPRGFAFAMEGVTARVWQLLETPRSEAEIVAVLGEEYDVDAAQCRREVSELMDRLREEGLIEETGE